MLETFIRQAPDYIPVLTDPATLKVDIILAIITFLAVLVALFQEKIKDFFNRARLSLEINLNPPDCHQIDLTDPAGRFVSKSIYLRIRVINTKGKTAQNVEIIASNLWRKNDDGFYKTVSTFLPMNLAWSHTHPITQTIPPKSFRFCDLGPIRPVDEKVILKLDTITQPNPVAGNMFPNVIYAGQYKLELLISGDNTKPKITNWVLEFSDEWSDDEDTMMKNIKIEKL